MMRGYGKIGKTNVIPNIGVCNVHDLWHY